MCVCLNLWLHVYSTYIVEPPWTKVARHFNGSGYIRKSWGGQPAASGTLE